ncbi:hypothetical protein SAY87_025107 [Trapa incisa]|uniref:Uncharacterized protein n=1 Tax=Trapa incisa TaxID=236973 RepID=A0AAN7JFJ0_9MYRT|nr:hypothetical protein SAY87_025107 [Trapa incisa]
MAVDVCSEISSPGISPRISFSHDLKDCDDRFVPVEDEHRRSDGYLLESSSNFDFCIGAAAASAFIHELSSAEELFSGGKILPVEIKKAKLIAADPPRDRQEPMPPAGSDKKRLKEFLLSSSDTDEAEDQTPPPKSFWQFKRSNSLNCESTRSMGLIRSLHFLSRSKSTGSAINPKQNLIIKEGQRQGQSFRRQRSVPARSSSASSMRLPYSYGSWRQQQGKQNANANANPPPQHWRGYGNGVRISPVLNFQPTISIGTLNLFSIGSLFCNGKKVKRKKKK